MTNRTSVINVSGLTYSKYLVSKLSSQRKTVKVYPRSEKKKILFKPDSLRVLNWWREIRVPNHGVKPKMDRVVISDSN
jgi:hypothetical protein